MSRLAKPIKASTQAIADRKGREDGEICPVCGKHTFSEHASYEICPVCGWEDDIVQRKKPDFPEGANGMSLNEYKKRAADKGIIR